MLLAVDVGNTNIMMGVFQDKDLTDTWRVSTDPSKTADELGVLFKQLFEYKGISFSDISAVAISSVVPPIMQALDQMCREYIGVAPFVVGHGSRIDLAIEFDNPKEIGADRIVNAVGAIDKYGSPAVVVDFGTATTFDAISDEGHYLGGAIAPGVGISLEALFQKAAKLPRIEMVKPEGVIGKSTVTCMQSGIVFGFVGQVDGIVQRIKRELGPNTVTVATGGLAPFIAGYCETIDHIDPYLTLNGLQIIYRKNQ
ncbi:MAG: type III pantothenate kinase [Bacillota bacterium]